MRKKDRGMPEIVFIGPPKHRVPHKQVVFLIEEEDANGIPRKLRLLLDEESVHIDEGMAFMTAYVQEHMTKPKVDT